MEESVEKIIRQHNLITQSRHSLSSLEMDIFLMLLSKLDEKDRGKGVYTVELDEIEGYRGREINSTRLRESVSSLRSREYFIDKEDGSFITVGVLASAEYVADERLLHLEVPRVMEQFLFDLKGNFTAFYLSHILSLHSKFSKRIYQMLCQFRSTGIYKTSIEKLKRQLGLIEHDGKEQYKMVSAFRKYVLDVAQEELSQTDMPFTYDLIKKGRKYKSIEFHFSTRSLKPEYLKAKKLKTPKPMPIPTLHPEEEQVKGRRTLYERMTTDFQLSHAHILSIFGSFSQKDINKALHELKLKIVNKEVSNIESYTRKWFENLLLKG